MVFVGYPLGFPRFFRIESPRISIRWALWTSRSRMPSARVGSPICACHRQGRGIAPGRGRSMPSIRRGRLFVPGRKLRNSCPHPLVRARTHFRVVRPRPILAPAHGLRFCPARVRPTLASRLNGLGIASYDLNRRRRAVRRSPEWPAGGARRSTKVPRARWWRPTGPTPPGHRPPRDGR
jgi:hypothetical protein